MSANLDEAWARLENVPRNEHTAALFEAIVYLGRAIRDLEEDAGLRRQGQDAAVPK